MKAKILVVDDDADLLKLISKAQKKPYHFYLTLSPTLSLQI